MAKVQIGTGVTNANGVAVMSEGYVGSGAGKIQLVAEVEVDGSTVVSQPYEVLDCIFYDEATSSDTKNSNWTASNITATTGSGYTSLSKTTSTSTGNYTCGTQITEPCVIEWDNLHNPDGNNYILIGSDYLSLVDVVVNSHVKVVVDETKFTLYLVVDGVDVQKGQKNLTGTLSSGLSITLRVHSSSQRSIGYNNFKVYKT